MAGGGGFGHGYCGENGSGKYPSTAARSREIGKRSNRSGRYCHFFLFLLRR
jgi:hypothetical protein